MITCMNQGCGKDFDPENNPDDSCRHHPGKPYFHDGKKEWDCCGKKSVDFTEFLNIKGCVLSKHSDVRKTSSPVEPPAPKPKVEESVTVKMPEPLKSTMERPSYSTEMTQLKPIVAPNLKNAIDNLVIDKSKKSASNVSSGIPEIGTHCKNNACDKIYESPSSNNSECIYHSGYAIFHEGLKYWSCCTKRTTDFRSFMEQKGCCYGKHKWIADNLDEVKCRFDWHQTAADVVVSVYAKMYDYNRSFVKINPVRLNVCLVFPEKNDAEFNFDQELHGIIKASEVSVQMFATKVEISMPKAEPGHWPCLYILRQKKTDETSKENTEQPAPDPEDDDSDLDLDDIEQVRGIKIAEA